jgi:hypothetical protein
MDFDFLQDWLPPYGPTVPFRIRDFFIWLAIWTVVGLFLWIAATWPESLRQIIELF